MTGTRDSLAEGVLRQASTGILIARACCVLVALLVVAAIVYGGVTVVENYGQIAV